MLGFKQLIGKKTTSTAAWDVEMGKRPETEDQGASSPGICSEILRTGIWRLWLILAVFYTCLAIQLPIRPHIFLNFFASKRAGFPADCAEFKEKEPAFCKAAHSDAVWAQAICDCISMTCFNFLLAPLVGRLSDRYGRRPFLATVLALSTLAPVLMALHETIGAPTLFVYFPAQALIGDGLLLSLSAAYVSDLISPGNRATALSLNLAGLSVAYTVGPIISGSLWTIASIWVSAGGTCLSILMMLLLVPESASEPAKLKAQERHRADGWTANAPWQCFRVMVRSRLFSLLAVVAALSSLVQMGIMSVLPQFLKLTLAYTKSDLGVLFTVAGAFGIFVQVVAIRLLQRCLGETGIIIFSTAMRLLEVIVFCFGGQKAFVFLGLVFGGLSYLVNVACSSILSKHTPFHEQGNVQGALYGILCFTGGLGSPTFALVFDLFSSTSSSMPYFPGAPFLYGAAVMLLAFLVTLFVNRKEAQQDMEDDQCQASELSFTRTLATLGRNAEESKGGNANAASQGSAGDPGPSQTDDHISIVIHSDPDTPPVPPSCFQTAPTLQPTPHLPQHGAPSLVRWTNQQPKAADQTLDKQSDRNRKAPTPRGILAQYRRHPDSEIVPDGVTPDMIAAVQQERQKQQEAEQTPPRVPRLDLGFLSQSPESHQREDSKQRQERGFYIYRGAKGAVFKIPTLDLSFAHGTDSAESCRSAVSPPRGHFFHRGANGDVVKVPTLDLSFAPGAIL